MQSIESASEASVAVNELKDQQTDELQQRVKFLHSCEMFSHIKNTKNLLQVAINLTVVKFKYGEFLTREG